jgi:hypothetical protein
MQTSDNSGIAAARKVTFVASILGKAQAWPLSRAADCTFSLGIGMLNSGSQSSRRESMTELGAVLGQLKQERARTAAELRQLDQAIQALSQVTGGSPGPGRRVKRTMSVAARRRIAAAQRARWAKFHAGRKKAA